MEEDIAEAKQAQLKCEHDMERLMQKKHLSKADMTLLPLRHKIWDELAEELKQLHEKKLLLLRHANKQ